MKVISCLEDSSLRHAIPSDSPFLLLLLPCMSLSFRGFSKAVPFSDNHSTATYSQRFHQLCLFNGSFLDQSSQHKHEESHLRGLSCVSSVLSVATSLEPVSFQPRVWETFESPLVEWSSSPISKRLVTSKTAMYSSNGHSLPCQ